MTLHDRLLAEVERRKALAVAALDEWAGIEAPDSWGEVVADFADAHDPADALRRYERDLKVLARHQAIHMNPPAECRECSSDVYVHWPCAEILDLAAALDVEVTP
jgi:hypothetical protein